MKARNSFVSCADGIWLLSARLVFLVVVMAAILISIQPLCAEDIAVSPFELIDKLQVAANVSSVEIDQLTDSLIKLGDSALPAIQEGLAREDSSLNTHLLRVLGGIPGDGSTSLLVSAIPMNQSAIGRLENREIRRELTPEELAAIVTAIKSKNVASAGVAARVLAKCIKVPIDVRINAILPPFKEAVITPITLERIPGSYLSPRVHSLNQFLLAFSYIGEPTRPILLESRAKTTDGELGKWLLIALGMAGERGMANDLRQLVQDDPDRYVRCVAVRAYAHSSGADAIPFLQSLLSNDMESEYYHFPNGQPMLLIHNAAKGELARIARESR